MGGHEAERHPKVNEVEQFPNSGPGSLKAQPSIMERKITWNVQGMGIRGM